MKRKNLGRATLVALPFLLALATDLVLLGVFRDRLPGQLASHFRADGRSDGYAGQVWHAMAGVLLFAVTGALWALTVVRGKFYGWAYRWLVAGGYAFAGFLGWVMTAVLLANVDAGENAQGEAQGVSFPMWQLAVALGVAVLAGGLGMALAALGPVPKQPTATGQAGDGARIALADGEVAGWARSAGSWWLPLIALGLVAGGVVLLFVSGWAAAIPLLLLGVLLAAFARPYVVVDRRGITISGMLPWPRLRVPLDRIEAATSRDINPLAEYGGWGYRIRPGRSGLMIRSGEGIVATLAGGRDFAVTVDDSATGAALLNTLIDQRRAEH
ncbi:DUF1648 domain-containing protein [Streptomyces sp. Ncost-T10-10d]|uniref:DUF1648 domain-containing protein n=1 Tax=Streptomyces sp. Ncost-T10-10d TaxID=1839774 RepID=UPI00081EBED7|nr:DUF1648 domain-containing protein [Streptomyces sp. Ncost-T10-10d]SCF93024.1 hypothetical protein GA0115254_125133 [Streptomyces sp. Ncost-T10-10d]